MCIHIFLLNSHLRWSSVLYDFSYCTRSDSFGLWHCSIFSCCLKKEKKSEREEACADWLHLRFLTGSQAVGKSRTANAPHVPTSLALKQAIVSLNTIIVSGCHLKEMLHLRLIQKRQVTLPSEAVFITSPSAEDGWLTSLLAAVKG